MTYQEYMNLLQTKVIDILNKGINPWQVEERARNGMSDRYYSGANALMLNISSLLFHEGDMRWYTLNQANKIGSHVIKEQKATPAYFFQNTVERPKKDEDGNIVKDKNGLIVYETVRIPPIFKVYYVFNARQLDPVPPRKDVKHDTTYDKELAETILLNSPVSINYVPNPKQVPSYRPGTDEITMPLKSTFLDEPEFFSTAFHEMAHSTGAINRLARKIENPFGNEPYAIEELVAEITALSLCEDCNMKYTNTTSADYIASWLQAIKDPDFKLSSIYSAVSKAARFLEHPEDRTRLIAQGRNNEDELFLFNGEKYLHLQRSYSDEEPWDYTIYDKDLKDLDGGRFGKEGLKTSDAIDQISQYHDLDPSIWTRVELSILNRTEEPSVVAETPASPVIESEEAPKAETKTELHMTPVIRFTYSDNYRVPIDKDMTMAEADKLLASLNEDARRYEETIPTKFNITVAINGKDEECPGRYVIGRDSGTIFEHLTKENEEFLTNKRLRENIKRKHGDEKFSRLLDLENLKHDKILPALSCHIGLDEQQERSETLLERMEKRSITTVEREFIEYSRSVLDWVEQQRKNIGTGKAIDLLHPPQLEDFQYIMPENGEAIKTVYISGPITADPNHRERFKNAEESLSQAGYKAINPVELVKGKIPENLSAAETWRRAMEIDLDALRHSDAVVILDKNGLESTGMDIETHLATRLNIPLVTLDHILSWKKEQEKKTEIAKEQPNQRSVRR